MIVNHLKYGDLWQWNVFFSEVDYAYHMVDFSILLDTITYDPNKKRTSLIENTQYKEINYPN